MLFRTCSSVIFSVVPINQILWGAILNASGALVRILSQLIISTDDNSRYAVAMGGQVLAALAQPFLYCISTKVAEQWFPENQRALATSLAVMANLVGQLIASGITPQFIRSDSAVEILNISYGVPCFIGAIGAIFIIRSSKPDVPPSNSAAITTNYPYCSALKTFFSRKESFFLLFGVGSVLGVSYTLMSRMEEILCPQGYEDKMAGWCTLALMGFGLLGAVLTSNIADRTRSFTPITKICLAFMVLSLCFFVVIVRYENQKTLIVTASGLVGFWAYAAFPVGLELAIEHSFTILPEATSSGLILITGQFLSIIYFIFFEVLSTDSLSTERETCTKTRELSFTKQEVHPQDSMCPRLILAGITTFLVCIFILFFKSDYNRMKTENRSMSAIVNDDDPIISSTSFEDPNWHTSIYS